MNPRAFGWQLARIQPAKASKGMLFTGSKGLLWSGAGGAALGAGVIYYLDPQLGARRRAEIAQQARHLAKEFARGYQITARDVRYRSRGAARELEAFFSREPVSDTVLAARVRSRLGRLCSHAHAIDVRVSDGRVELRGPILKRELSGVLRGLSKVRGVRALENQLEVHPGPDHVPSLQGEGAGAGEKPELLQTYWSPTARLVAGTCGAGLLGFASIRGGPMGIGLGICGAALLARSLTNLELKRLIGVGAGPRAIDVQKAIYIERPPEEVFSYFREFENLPQFMSHVKAVQRIDEGKWRWTVAGPGQVPFSWEALVTELVPYQLIGWKSVEGSLVRTAGEVRFDPEGTGTRFSVRMSYNPPAGALGHAVAKLFGSDAKKQLDDDLLRLKTMLETGRTREARPEDRPFTH